MTLLKGTYVNAFHEPPHVLMYALVDTTFIGAAMNR